MNAALRPLPLEHDTGSPSVFLPENLLREARRQRGLAIEPVPDICVLDPDGDLAAFLAMRHRATAMAGWACFHPELLICDLPGTGRVGVVGKVSARPTPFWSPNCCSRPAAASSSTCRRPGRSPRSPSRPTSS